MSDQIRRYISIYGGSGSSHFSNGGSSRYVSSDPLAASSAGMYSAHDRRSERVSSLYSNETDSFMISSYEVPGTGGARGFPSSMIGAGIGAAPAGPAFVRGVKRSAEALYHQTILGSHTSGQTEALFSTNSLVKRPRQEIASNLPIYPQRPGEKDCAHYMMTRICKFGDTCKFDHPIWVPEGGIPDWKEIPFAPTSDTLPERPGEPDCPYYMKTQKCKYGFRCKFNHPKDILNTSAIGKGTESTDNSVLPERLSEPICSFYVKTGTCKFGASCKFHHPKDAQVLAAGQDTGSMELAVVGMKNNDAAGGDSKPMKTFVPFTPALLHNSKGLPIRSGETDCPFYLKTGSCKYGAMCRYNHPDINSVNLPALASLGNATMASTVANLPIGVLNTAANLLPNINPQLAQTSLGVAPMIYAQRPGQVECDFYMKTGQCSFGERCKFHHPIDRSAPTSAANQMLQQNVKLTLAGLPRREGAVSCPFYMKTGTCNYGALCRFDHPPPGEAIAMATTQETGLTAM